MTKGLLESSTLAAIMIIFTLGVNHAQKDLGTVNINWEKVEINHTVPVIVPKIPEPKVSNIIIPDDLDEEIWEDSLEYVAMCVEAEAGNQGFLGKTYVADVILNRYDKGDYFTYYDVINETGQFSCVTDRHIFCVPTEETYEVVRNELSRRTADNIIYFRTGRYSDYGTPAFKYRDHYFSED